MYFKYEQCEMESIDIIKNHIENTHISQNIKQFSELKNEIDKGLLSKDEYQIEYNFLLQRIYLEYFNDFLSIEKFAEYYYLEPAFAEKIIIEGRKLNKE